MTTDGRAQLLKSMTEAQFRSQVITWAKRAGWLVSSMHDSRRQTWGTDRGIPDLIMAREGRVIFAELKKMGGRATPDQTRWMFALAEVESDDVAAVLWRPDDEEMIKRTLA